MVTEQYYKSGSGPGANLKLAIKSTGQDILEEARANRDLDKMGFTVAVMVKGSAATVAHPGDVRAYLLRNGQLRHPTKDHTSVQERVDSGALTEGQVHEHPNRNIITRPLGGGGVPSATVSQLYMILGTSG